MKKGVSMSKGEVIREKLRSLIPGGAHTYTKGDDQWPANAPSSIERAKGCYAWDADGNRYIDWSMGLTSVAFGHANEEINNAVVEGMSLGNNFQRPSVVEAMAAERLLNFFGDRGEMVKFSKNGSTVTTAAVKLSRAFTRRAKVAVCNEHPFFSYDDWFIGSTRCPDGVPGYVRDLTVKFSYNDISSVHKMFKDNLNDIACVIVEPVKFDKPANGFLHELYEVCKKNGTLLILDEMVTGFKWHKQGAGKYYDNAKADLYTWGKGMANGHSVCALTGRRDVMELGGIHHNKPRVFLCSTTHGAEVPQLVGLIKVLDMIDANPSIFEDNFKKGALIKKNVNELVKKNNLEDHISLVGEDCFFTFVLRNVGKHKPNVARTYLLQELVREGQLFQGLFYPTMAHTDEALKSTYAAWANALPRYRTFLESGTRQDLVGEPTKPVFRTFNSCECLSVEDCNRCYEKLKTL